MNEQNLTGHSFKEKPQNRNKAGRPKKLPALIDVVDKCLLETEGGQIAIERMIRALIDQALNGSVQAARCLLEFRYGKPKMSFDITTNGKDLVPEKNTLIVSPAGTITDIYGNYICDLPADKMNMFQHKIVFIDPGIRDSDGNITSLPPELMENDDIPANEGKSTFAGF